MNVAELLAAVSADELRAGSIRGLASKHGVSAWVVRQAKAALGAGRNPRGGDAADVSDGAYTYSAASDTYTFQIRAHGQKTLKVLPGDTVREMVRDYVEDGSGRTMLEVAVKHGITRRQFEAIKTALQVTKRHEPATPEEIASGDEEILAEEFLAAKRQRLAARVDREDYARVKDAASKWYALQRGASTVRDLLGVDLPRRTVPARSVPRGGDFTFFQPSDLHFGAKVDAEYGGVAWDRALAERALFDAVAGVVEEAGGDFLVYGVGGDVTHADNVQGRTTSTKNQMDLDGLPEVILAESIRVQVEVVRRLLDAFDLVHLEAIPGNHDYYTTVATAAALQHVFAADDRVSFGNVLAPFAFWAYEDVALCLHHGHGVSTASALADQLGTWARRTATPYRHGYAITGNLHHLTVKEDPGITLLQQPSPCPADRYAALNGFNTSRPAMVAFDFDGRRGLRRIHYFGA